VGLLKKCFSGLMPSFRRRRESRSFIVLPDARSPLNACEDKFLGHDKHNFDRNSLSELSDFIRVSNDFRSMAPY